MRLVIRRQLHNHAHAFILRNKLFAEQTRRQVEACKNQRHVADTEQRCGRPEESRRQEQHHRHLAPARNRPQQNERKQALPTSIEHARTANRTRRAANSGEQRHNRLTLQAQARKPVVERIRETRHVADFFENAEYENDGENETRHTNRDASSTDEHQIDERNHHRPSAKRVANTFYERLQYRLHSKADSHARESENHARNQRDDHDAERKELALDMVRGDAVPLAKDLLDGLGRRRFMHNL